MRPLHWLYMDARNNPLLLARGSVTLIYLAPLAAAIALAVLSSAALTGASLLSGNLPCRSRRLLDNLLKPKLFAFWRGVEFVAGDTRFGTYRRTVAVLNEPVISSRPVSRVRERTVSPAKIAVTAEQGGRGTAVSHRGTVDHFARLPAQDFALRSVRWWDTIRANW